MRIMTVAETQALESVSDAAGHSYEAMMDRAGSAVALAIQQRRSVSGRHVLVLVGPGHNGGDGLVAGRRLAERGAIVTAYLVRPRDEAEDPVYSAAIASKVRIQTAGEDESSELLKSQAAAADIIIDALLGTGATPPLRGALATVIATVQSSLAGLGATPLTYVVRGQLPGRRPLIVAVDGPSGLDFDTGEIDDGALQADMTVTFATPKWGHCRMPGAAKVGELVIADIGIPETVEIPAGPELATPGLVGGWLPKRSIDAHKGTFGKALIVAGSANYTGAAILAARAAVRAGTGLVTLGTPSSLHSAVVPAMPEVTYLLLPHSLGVLNQHAAPVVREHAAGYSAMLIGPGLGNTSESQAFLTALLGSSGQKRSTGFIKSEHGATPDPDLPPLVVDADGLNILATMSGWAQRLPKGSILTPHPGEMSRLTGLSTQEVQGDRLEIAREWADKWEHIVVLKGAFTVVAAPGRQPIVLPFANSGLSSAGTGDVLAGTIVALRAQGLDAFPTAVAGAYVHGLAGEIATIRFGAAGTAATDVVGALPAALRRLMPEA
ncbi:MAG: NAD(P)H-hydrate dehydratase [Anaerolineae bacterium]|nr:NAD(P)H-hydrate dehydratase [Anaerolineae bacterium]